MLGFRGEQFMFVRMQALPKTAADSQKLQAALADFMRVDLPKVPSYRRPKAQVACLSATMTTRQQQLVRSHNASVVDVKRHFRSSNAATALRTFLDSHNSVLKHLIQRERVRIFGTPP